MKNFSTCPLCFCDNATQLWEASSLEQASHFLSPLVNQENLFSETGLTSLKNIPKNTKYTCILFALGHAQFDNIDYIKLKNLTFSDAIIFDLTNTIKGEDIIHF